MRTLGSPDIIYILMAVRWTLLLSLVAFLGGALGGALVALARTGEYRWLRVASAGYIKVFQGTPLLMQLFLAFFVPGLFGWSVDPWTAAALGLSLHASAFLGEIWRGAIEVVPRGQWEAATSLGLRYAPKMALIIAPQAIRSHLYSPVRASATSAPPSAPPRKATSESSSVQRTAMMM